MFRLQDGDAVLMPEKRNVLKFLVPKSDAIFQNN